MIEAPGERVDYTAVAQKKKYRLTLREISSRSFGAFLLHGAGGVCASATGI